MVMYIRLSVKKKISSEGWFIQSWPSPKAVAIGCTRMTSSGAVEGCQLPTRGQSPGRRCLGDAFISQRYCDLYRTPRPPTPSLHTHPSPPFWFFLGFKRVLTHSLLFAAVARCARDPQVIYSRQDVLRTTLCGHVVLGARIASALWIRRCWRAAGREQPMRPGDRSRRWLVRPMFVPHSVDASILLLLWDIYLRSGFGEILGRKNLSTLLGWGGAYCANASALKQFTHTPRVAQMLGSSRVLVFFPLQFAVAQFSTDFFIQIYISDLVRKGQINIQTT
jgi:hypothetical protein